MKVKKRDFDLVLSKMLRAEPQKRGPKPKSAKAKSVAARKA